jgi:hypothetical protein
MPADKKALIEANDDSTGRKAPREFKAEKEKQLKRKLINLLRDDGKGHRHAKYAERLEKFDIQIVPLRADPNFTAAISFDRGIIFIGEGFLNDPATFYQLNVLLRHELAHNLLMHQIRMAYKLGEEANAHMSLSASLFNLQNIIADDEISNRKYSEEDKIIVRNMMLNGRLIGGLVTEDHRANWINMSIEEMYEKVCEEIEEIETKLLDGKSLEDIDAENPEDFIQRELLGVYSVYNDTTGSSAITVDLKTLIDNDFKIGRNTLRKELSAVIKAIYDELEGKEITDEEIDELLNKIAKSAPVKTLDLFNNGKVKLYTPEEKSIAIETLKKYRSEYAEWYQRVLHEMDLDTLSAEQLKELLELVK